MSVPTLTVPTLTVSARTLEELQWHRVRERARAHSQNPVGHALMGEDTFLTDVDAVRAELRLVSEFKAVIDAENQPPPLGGVTPLDAFLERSEKDGVLEAEELVLVADALRAGHLTQKFLERNEERAGSVAGIVKRLPDLEYLFRRLFDTFEPDGTVRDDASPRLAELRARLAWLHGRLRSQIQEHLQDDEADELLQDSYYTLRKERYVLPVKAHHRKNVPGIVHGSSNTGQTLYIEPEALIQTNNQLKVAEQEAEREIWLIRKECSEMVAEVSDEIREAVQILGRLDSLAARALFSLELHASEPVVVESGAARLDDVRNPLLVLQGVRVVPNDIILGDGFLMLVVTGPNTGGKTVTLSTLGLCALMTQAGYHVPAAPDSQVPVFRSIHSSMSDAQNIEQGLSTFSGHLRRLTDMLEDVDDRSLVLLDEILVGTEPSQGSALAVAFLEEFASRGVFGAISTHYDRLKTLSYADERFRNASVGLDPQRLTPTYELSTGLPGSSSPISIASKLGIAPSIVARAEEVVGGKSLNLDKIVRDLETEREALATSRAAVEAERRTLERSRREHEEQLRRLRRDADRMAREECKRTMNVAEDMRRELERMRKEIRRRKATEKELDGTRRKVRDIEQKVREVTPTDPDKPKEPERRALTLEKLEAGMAVWVAPFKAEGRIEKEPRDPKRIEISVGGLRTTVTLDALREAAAKAPPKQQAQRRPRGAGDFKAALPNYDERTPTPRVSDNTCDVRGMTREDALISLEKHLDDAANTGRPVVWVIHGHGSGALKKAIRDFLAASAYVAHWRRGERSEGGDGVSLVWVD